MKILHRYVLQEHLGPLLLGLLVFTFILLLKSFFKLADLLVNAGVDVSRGLHLFVSLLPGLLSITLPMAVLISVLLAFGRLASDKEILAIRTTGYNLVWLFVPVIIIAVILTGMMIYLNMYYIPNCNFTSSSLEYEIRLDIINSLSPGRFYGGEGLGSKEGTMSLYFDDVDDETGDMLNVVLKYLMPSRDEDSRDDKRKIVHIVAKRGRLSTNREQRNIKIDLYDGSVHSINKDNPDQYDILRFPFLNRELPLEMEDFEGGKYDKSYQEMTLDELLETIGKKTKKAKSRQKAFVELVQRVSIPFACVTFVLLGIPLGIAAHPSGKSTGFGISFAMILVYYWLLKRGIVIGRDSTNALYTIFSIAFPNILFGAIGIILMIRTVRK